MKKNIIIYLLPFIFFWGACSKQSSSHLKSIAEEKLIIQGGFFSSRYNNFEKIEDYEYISNGKIRVLVKYRNFTKEHICFINESNVYALSELKGYKTSKKSELLAMGEVVLICESDAMKTTAPITAVLKANASDWIFITQRFSTAHRWLREAKALFKDNRNQ